jgi:hypothetical protein
MPQNHLIHGEYIGGKVSPEYAAFVTARTRCETKTNAAYHKYGGRGIRFLYAS